LTRFDAFLGAPEAKFVLGERREELKNSSRGVSEWCYAFSGSEQELSVLDIDHVSTPFQPRGMNWFMNVMHLCYLSYETAKKPATHFTTRMSDPMKQLHEPQTMERSGIIKSQCQLPNQSLKSTFRLQCYCFVFRTPVFRGRTLN